MQFSGRKILTVLLRARALPRATISTWLFPEREDLGKLQRRVSDIPKVIGGFTPLCLQKAMEVYDLAVKTLVPVSSFYMAEPVKLLENIFRSVNIALVN
jgi:UDP-N-acetyl-D-glucosamine dehydrogenase